MQASTGMAGRAGSARAVQATASASASRSTWIFTGSCLQSHRWVASVRSGYLAYGGAAPRPTPSYLFLGLGDKEISSRSRPGGTWGQAAISQPSVALRDHSPCVSAMAWRGRAVDGLPFSTGCLPVTPRTSGVVLALSQACPQRYPQPVCTDCYGRR